MVEQTAQSVRLTRPFRKTLVAAVVLVLAWAMIYYYYGVLLPVRSGRVPEMGAANGTWSDLYPRWYGARELLFHHRNPYSPAVTAEIQRGFYGHSLNPSPDRANPDRERDPEEFVYPVYIVFLLAPFLTLPFHFFSVAFTVLLLILTPATVWLWMKALDLRLSPQAMLLSAVAFMSSYPAIDGLHLQQLTLLVAALMASAIVALVSGCYALAGLLLALAMIKPQLAILTVALLVVWTLGDWSSRKLVLISFGAVMAVLLISSELVLPGWFWLWQNAAHSYVAHHKETLMVAVFHLQTAKILGAASLVALAILFWLVRKQPAGSPPFSFTLLAALMVTTVFLPNFGSSYYNEVLLLPVVLWMFTSGWRALKGVPLSCALFYLAAAVFVAEWVAALPVSLSVLLFHTHFERETTWFVAGPEALIFYFPVFLGVFLLSAGPRAWRRA